MRNSFLLLFAFLLSGIHSFSQAVEPAIGIHKSQFQIELESIYSVEKKHSETSKSWTIPGSLVRYGLSNRIELQLNIPIIKEHTFVDDHLVHSFHHIGDAQLGSSFNLWNGKKTIPDVAILLCAVIPMNTKQDHSSFGNLISLNMAKDVFEKFNISVNVGSITETTGDSTNFYIANFDYQVTDTFHLFIENHCDFKKNIHPNQVLSTGFGFQMLKHYAVDVSFAKGLNHKSYFAGVIFSVLLG